MSAAEKLKALDEDKTFNPMHLWNALPQIVAVVEAAQQADHWWLDANSWGEFVNDAAVARAELLAALAALDEALR